jgi:hypothetical protein
MSARVIEIVGRWHDHDRHAAIETLKRHRKLPLPQGSYAHATHIRKTEHVVQELFNESIRGSVRWGLACGQIGNERLANAKMACDFVTQRKAFRYAVVGLGLCTGLMLRDPGEHRGGPIAGHIKPRSGPKRKDR